MPDRARPRQDPIRSRQNRRVQEARRLARNPRAARREGLLVADGTVLVREALQAGLPAQAIFVDPDDPDLPSIGIEARRRRIALTPASASVIAAISTLRTPQGAIGIFARPRHDPAAVLAAADRTAPPLVAVLHGLQDPANAGSLVRSALAAGLAGLLATEGTVDLFHPRAVRAAMGASFRLPLATDLSPSVTWEILRRGRYETVGLDPRGEVLLREFHPRGATAIVLSREGSGLDRTTRTICQRTVRIPMAPGVESLGVAAAGAIVFYALRA